MSNENAKKMGLGGLFAVASVWFGSHAGGGFATGNQATQYYVQYGWSSVIMPILSMALLAWVLREAIVMCNNHGFSNYKPLFEEMWAPYSKLEILFEIYFYIIVICAVGGAIAGAATLFTEFGIPYIGAVLIVGAVLFVLTILGAKLVARASTIMSIVILTCCAIIFTMGIKARGAELLTIVAERQSSIEQGFMGSAILMPIWKTITYAGFQCVVLPALVSCAAPLKTAKNATNAMILGFIMNGFALGFSCWMLLGWYGDYTAAKQLALPTLYICKQLGQTWLYYAYSISLFLCFVSTGVTSIYGLVPRFENAKALAGIKNVTLRRGVISFIAMAISMGVSLVGLSNVIKYGYGYCGIFGLFIIVIPMLTIGRSKNQKFLKEHPEFKG